MQYVGIDIAKRAHVAGSRREDGTPHGKPFKFANDQRGFASLLRRLSELGATPEDTLLVMESTGHYWLALWEFCVAHGYDVAVVNPVLTDAFRRADTLRKTKTDDIDAFLIAEYARFKRLGPSRVSPEDAEGLKQLTRYRASVVVERTALKNRLTSVADRTFPELSALVGGNDSATTRALMGRYGSARAIARANILQLTKVVREASRGHFGREKAEEVKAAAKASVGTSFAAGALAVEAESVVRLIGLMDDEVARLDGEIAELLDPEVGAILQSVPGIGPVLSAEIAAEVGDPDRFETPKQLVAYAGMDATKAQSGQLDGESGQHMSKRGSSHLRNALMTAADGARRYDPYFGEYYDHLTEGRGKHHYVALSAVARKLCGVILALLRERRKYEARTPVSYPSGARAEAAG
ncbi:MAG: IS110 family transposase [Atopobiaceae bacterium]|nr:IS110 family transposase [Atopobiaceae bacterium]